MKIFWCIEKNNYRNTAKVFMTFLLFASISSAYPQNPTQKVTRQTAQNEFNNGKFDIAYGQFSELATLYPKDPLYKYYLGACLVKLEKEPKKASVLLDDAIRESAAIRSVPADALFYLGRAQQMSGKFPEAIRSFESFTSQAGKKIAKELDVPELINQCEDGKGIIEPEEEIKVSTPVKDTTAILTAEVAPSMDAIDRIVQDSLKDDRIKLPDPYEELLSEALDLQSSSDSALSAATKYRREMDSAAGASKSVLWIKIRDLEKLSASYRADADLKMIEAGKLAGIPEETLKGTIVEKEAEPAARDSVVSDTTDAVKDQALKQADSTIVAIKPKPEVLKPAVTTAVYSDFKVTEKPVYKTNEKVELNPDVPAGLIYRIQVGIFRNPVALSYFKGISPVNGFKNEATGITSYYAGIFRKSSDAGKALTIVKSLGFKDAFVVALMDKKTVSAERAAILEKEWGSKPLYSISQTKPEVIQDTVPPTLVFRVEVKRSPKPLPKDQVEDIKKMAGNRGFDILVTEKKQNIYLIGTFLTYKSASEFSDLLITNGYRDAKVVAYLGKREIPVETARQLFEEY